MISLDAATVRYPAFQLGPIDLDLGSGVTCLVGANGAGKSTMFRILSGVEQPTDGQVLRSDDSRVGYLPQDLELPAGSTARQFLVFVGWLHGMRADAAVTAADDVLARVGLADRGRQRIGAMSGGMQRRLGVAHALVHGPDLVLLDEPTVGLDPLQRGDLRDTIAHVARDRGVIVSTHLTEDVRVLADRVVVLSGGAVAFDGSVTDLEALGDDGVTTTGEGATRLDRAVATLLRSREIAA